MKYIVSEWVKDKDEQRSGFLEESWFLSFLFHPVRYSTLSIWRVGKETQTVSSTGAFNPCEEEEKSQSSDRVIRRTRSWTDSTSGAVTLICVSQCEFVRVTVSTCIKWRRAELQTSRSVKIKVKNTSTIKTGCSYLMSWKPPWEPSLGGFVVVRQFQWPVLVPT